MQAPDEKQHVPATSSFVSCAPHRLCLFGEHQDYLGLPVIALSLQIYCRIRVEPQVQNRILVLEVPSLQNTVAYNLDDLPAPQRPDTAEPDFALAAIHEALQDGWTFPYGALCVSTIDDSDMPMKAGCSTSSAFCVAWVQALACLAGRSRLSPLSLAQRAYQAEVTHFHAPGGTMDHMTSALGGILRIGGGRDPWGYTSLEVLNERSRGVWILAYSGEPKDTMGHLWRCKGARLALLQQLDNDWDNNSTSISDDELELLKATRVNRDTEAMAFQKWTTASTGESANEASGTSNCLGRDLGALMMNHHNALRDGLHLSTPRLEAMNTATMKAGAWGFKVVGSGGGGCGVAWSSEEASMQVSAAMEKAGATKVWIIRTPSAGAHVLTKLHDGH